MEMLTKYPEISLPGILPRSSLTGDHSFPRKWLYWVQFKPRLLQAGLSTMLHGSKEIHSETGHRKKLMLQVKSVRTPHPDIRGRPYELVHFIAGTFWLRAH